MSARSLAIALAAATVTLSTSLTFAAGEPQRHAYSTAGGKAPAVQVQAAEAEQASPDENRSSSYTESQGTDGVARTQAQTMRPQLATPASADYWIHDAHVALLRDDDGDGFHHRFELNFDADTDYYSADVYARLYLSYEGGPYYLYYTTDSFTIDGSASDDGYEVTTTLTTGYPTGYYDLAIDLYEHGSGHIVASSDGYHDGDLAALPLEDLANETSGAPGVSLFTGIVLISDFDYDGYFHSFAIDIDVDMPHQTREVYAQIDVRTPHGAWLHEHTTGHFLVDGVGPHDLIRVNGDWETGYPPGRYDFRIGIYDAHTHELIVENGPDSLVLAAVPLEDAVSDHHIHPAPQPQPAPGRGHSVSHGYGGSSATGIWMLVVLGLGVLVRLGRRRSRG